MPRPHPLQTRPQNFDCGICSITYKAISAGCPLCAANREIREIREALVLAKNRLDAVTKVSNKNARDADLMHCIREAATMLNEDDRAFIKLVLYQWRDHRSIGALKATHNQDGSATGFLVVPRDGEPYGHECSSIGGLAIASHFDEAVRGLGQSDAMSILTRSLATLLPGGSAAGA